MQPNMTPCADQDIAPVLPNVTPYADQNITPELANLRLPLDKVVVGLYSNRRVLQSVVHSHPYHEYIYMISGKANYHVGGSRYELHPGEMLLIPPGLVHAGYYDTYDRLIIQMDDAFWRDTLRAVRTLGVLCDLPAELLILHRDAVAYWDLRGVIERAAAAATIRDAHDKEVMYRSLLVQLTLSIRQIIGADALSQPEATSPLIASVVTYIQNHYRDPDLNVTQLAQYAYVSREYLSRLFKEYTMQSIHSYLTDLRMQACRQDIADGKRVLDACLENGFSNYSSFVKTFRKMYGTTPQEYRAQLRNAIKAGPDAGSVD